MRTLEIDTPHGLARVHMRPHAEPRAALILGHGAGGGVNAADLLAASRGAESAGATVALVEQPYRRRSPAPARQLDAVWATVVGRLRGEEVGGLPLLVGGRSSGARVACRMAEAVGATGVLCLAFPLRPPGRSQAASRITELDAVNLPTLVVQGERDPFGIPPAGPQRTVVRVAGDHALKSDLEKVEAATRDWLAGVLGR